MRANSAPERLAVAVVKWRPAFGSTTPNTFAVPHRSYSLSCLAGFPGLAGIGGGPPVLRRKGVFFPTNNRVGRAAGVFFISRGSSFLFVYLSGRTAPRPN